MLAVEGGMQIFSQQQRQAFWRWFMGDASKKIMPGWVFFTQLFWAIGLLVLFLVYIHGNDRLDLPHSFGRVPIEAPWLGAIGGLLASLGGVTYYNHGSWDPRYNYWHPVKPLMGAASGSVACLLIIVLVRTATGSAKFTIDTTALDAAAFVFGYAEAAFRQLIAAVTTVFLKPGNETSKQKAAEEKAAEVKAAEVKAAEVKAAEVKAAEVKAAEEKAAEEKAAEEKAAEVKAAEVKAAEVKAAEVKAAEVKAAEEKAAEEKAAEEKAAEEKAAEEKAAEPKPAPAGDPPAA